MESPPTFFNHILAMPSPARGHINPMMNLCKLLISKNNNILVTFIVTEEWLTFISSEPKPDNISFRSIPNVVPSELIRGRDHADFMEAIMTRAWFFRVLNRVTIVGKQNGDERISYIPGISSTRLADFPLKDDSSRSKRMMQMTMKGFQWIHKAQYLLFTSIYELESQAIDTLKSKLPLPIYTIGPTIPYFINLTNNPKPNTTNSYIEWLDSQPTGSVLYIAQGSFFSASSEQIDEIANALCESNVRFLWVARGEATRLKEICGHMGLILEWCNQLRVLSHSSIGGFWSHCGWNSTKDGVIYGVPLLTFPINLDQPFNSKMMLRVKEDVKGDILVKKCEIVKLVHFYVVTLDGKFLHYYSTIK
ncbi:putative crocetin glucosyltransferase [Medicago truncatula]|uniref:Putative crocetin glucosyltransferase n=1 Tax=Medicago truncatula TaxID=3880 RepID=A0A396HVP9_MEDTR|nr:putative crocetin glucosyltransferase [Medicago truncatula]